MGFFGDCRGFCVEEPHSGNPCGAWTAGSHWGFGGSISTNGKFFKICSLSRQVSNRLTRKNNFQRPKRTIKTPFFTFQSGLLMVPASVMKALYGSDLDRGNKPALLLDALDASHIAQGLVEHHWRRVRQVRRVDRQFVTALLPSWHQISHPCCPKIFCRFS